MRLDRVQNGFETSLSSVKITVHRRQENCFSVPTLNFTLIMRQSYGTVVARSSKRLNALQGRAVKLMIPDTTLTTYHKLKVMRMMNQHKQLEYRGSCTRSLTVMRPQSIIISNLYIHPPSRCCNSRNSQLSLARPRIDIFRTNVAFAGAFYVEQRTSDSQILSFTQFLQAKTSCTP